MIILGVECTASPVSVALTENGKLVGEYFLNQKITHSQTLLPMCESLLKLSDVSINDIDAFAVTAKYFAQRGRPFPLRNVKRNSCAKTFSKRCIQHR